MTLIQKIILLVLPLTLVLVVGATFYPQSTALSTLNIGTLTVTNLKGALDSGGNPQVYLTGNLFLKSSGPSELLWNNESLAGKTNFCLFDPEYHVNQNILYMGSGINGEQLFDAVALLAIYTNASGQWNGQLAPRITMGFKTENGGGGGDGGYVYVWRFSPTNATFSTPYQFGSVQDPATLGYYPSWLWHNNTNRAWYGPSNWTNNFEGAQLNFNTNAVFAAPVFGGTNIQHQLINTNFISGQLYTNLYGTTVHVEACVELAEAAATAGDAGMSLEMLGNNTNFVIQQTTASTAAFTNTVMLSGWVTNNGTYAFTNKSTGAGNSALLVKGQLFVP